MPAAPAPKLCGEKQERTRREGEERAPAGYSQGDRAIGQRVRGQDLRELQAAAHHLPLGGARRLPGAWGRPLCYSPGAAPWPRRLLLLLAAAATSPDIFNSDTIWSCSFLVMCKMPPVHQRLYYCRGKGKFVL
jgi:hypothetical protein